MREERFDKTNTNELQLTETSTFWRTPQVQRALISPIYIDCNAIVGLEGIAGCCQDWVVPAHGNEQQCGNPDRSSF
jgi:hypothetical protein